MQCGSAVHSVNSQSPTSVKTLTHSLSQSVSQSVTPIHCNFVNAHHQIVQWVDMIGRVSRRGIAAKQSIHDFQLQSFGTHRVVQRGRRRPQRGATTSTGGHVCTQKIDLVTANENQYTRQRKPARTTARGAPDRFNMLAAECGLRRGYRCICAHAKTRAPKCT